MLKNLNRRKFIEQASCAALGYNTFFSTLNNLFATNNLAVAGSKPPDDYKAIVCILLAGGNDSYNMLLPKGAEEHADYAVTRSNLALERDSILALSGTHSGKSLGIHPSMPGIQQMYEAGDLAFIANAGTLIEPISNYADYQSGLKNLPLGLFSHADQIEQWQTSIPQSRQAIGWGGRMADLLKDVYPNQEISMNISLSGRNVFQSGNSVLEYTISNSDSGNVGIERFSPYSSTTGLMNSLRDKAIKSMMEDVHGNVFKETFANMTTATLDTQERFAQALAGVNNFQTVNFSEHYLSQNLRMMAKTIAAGESLNMNRQTFFTTIGGWDHHDEVIDAQEFLLGVVNNAIFEFYQALEELGMKDQVTLFTISDFARTLTSNGNGSDHAWGGNMMVAGGAVKGKTVYGNYPDLFLDGNDLIMNQRGNLISTISADQVFAELALWFGVSPNDLSMVFPNIGNFYNVNQYDGTSGNNPLGFL